MRTKIELYITNKMLKHFCSLSFEKGSGELAFSPQYNSTELRYLNNFMELGLIYEVPIDNTSTTFYITKVGEQIRKIYDN